MTIQQQIEILQAVLTDKVILVRERCVADDEQWQVAKFGVIEPRLDFHNLDYKFEDEH